MTANKMRYFKHIFAGSERIATKPCGEPCRTKGGGIPLVPVEAPPVKDSLVMNTQSMPSPPPVLSRDSLWSTYLNQTANCLGVQRQNLLLDFRINSLEARTSPINENTTYFYHSDHLGSTGYLSTHLQNGHARITQHYQYTPFGEAFVHQKYWQNTAQFNHQNPYQFNGKEKDLETGYNYYGARHYNATWGVWLSVDPLSDKYPSHSPYNYCMNNPVMLVDPDGRSVEGGGDFPTITILSKEGNSQVVTEIQASNPIYGTPENGVRSVSQTTISASARIVQGKGANSQEVNKQFTTTTTTTSNERFDSKTHSWVTIPGSENTIENRTEGFDSEKFSNVNAVTDLVIGFGFKGNKDLYTSIKDGGSKAMRYAGIGGGMPIAVSGLKIPSSPFLSNLGLTLSPTGIAKHSSNFTKNTPIIMCVGSYSQKVANFEKNHTPGVRYFHNLLYRIVFEPLSFFK